METTSGSPDTRTQDRAEREGDRRTRETLNKPGLNRIGDSAVTARDKTADGNGARSACCGDDAHAGEAVLWRAALTSPLASPRSGAHRSRGGCFDNADSQQVDAR
jgi:hypothetical protein